MFKHPNARGSVPIPFLLRALVLATVVLGVPATGIAQEREVVFNQIVVSSQEAGIELEFADGSTLSARFRDGRVTVNEEEIGAYSPGDSLEGSWRRLLSEAVAADNGEVVRLLTEWRPPVSLGAELGDVADALVAEFGRLMTPAPSTPLGGVQEVQEDALGWMILRPDYLRALTAAIVDARVRPEHVALSRDFRIAAGETLEGSLLALDSEIDVDGVLDGDLVLLGGRLRIGEDGRITGDLRWSESDLPSDRSGIEGSVDEIEPVLGISDSDLRDRIRSEVRAATTDARSTPSRDRRPRGGGFFQGLGGLFQTAVTFAIFLAVGLGVLHFFPRHLDIVSRTAAEAPGRSFLVGLAGGVLALPLWITGMIVLAVSIIGIPVLLLWIPAVPLVLAGLMILGYLAVSRNIGIWVAHRDFQGLEGMDTSRPAMQIGVGLLVLLGGFAATNFLQMGGVIFTPFAVALALAAGLLTLCAGSIGLGAVLLSRAGRDPRYAGDRWDPGPDIDPWAPSPDPFDPGPSSAGPAAHGSATKASGPEAAPPPDRGPDPTPSGGRARPDTPASDPANGADGGVPEP